ncbi:MAG: hypothetical protein IJH75_06480 [Mogibacterium sp.]|nr:hypothetical protein [Mogibacterium sp.]
MAKERKEGFEEGIEEGRVQGEDALAEVLLQLLPLLLEQNRGDDYRRALQDRDYRLLLLKEFGLQE